MDKIVYNGREYETVFFKIGNLPLIVVKAKKGYVATSYLSLETAEKVGDVAAFVAGVKDLNSFFNSKLKGVTSWAEDLGLREGMSVRKALELMDS